MLQIGRDGGRSIGREQLRIQTVHAPAFRRRKPKQIKGMCGHVTARRAGSQGSGGAAGATGLRRRGGGGRVSRYCDRVTTQSKKLHFLFPLRPPLPITYVESMQMFV